MADTQIATYHGEPGHWSGGYDTQPTPAPVYGRAVDRLGNLLALDIDVLVHSGMATTPRRAKVVGIGDQGLPNNPVAKVRQYGSAHIFSAACNACEPHNFDDYEWLSAETAAAATMTSRGVDLALCQFGGFYFDEYQRMAMKHYLRALAAAVPGKVQA